jgi:hypothetical protein
MLEPSEVRSLFGLSDPKEFGKFVAEQPLFPRPNKVGNTASGKPRLKFLKWKVYAFMDLWSAAGHDYGSAAPDSGPEEEEMGAQEGEIQKGKSPKSA